MPDDEYNGMHIVSVAFYQAIVEVAPFTEYFGCSFQLCEFVGAGPADFVECVFKDKMPRLPKVRIVPKGKRN